MLCDSLAESQICLLEAVGAFSTYQVFAACGFNLNPHKTAFSSVDQCQTATAIILCYQRSNRFVGFQPKTMVWCALYSGCLAGIWLWVHGHHVLVHRALNVSILIFTKPPLSCEPSVCPPSLLSCWWLISFKQYSEFPESCRGASAADGSTMDWVPSIFPPTCRLWPFSRTPLLLRSICRACLLQDRAVCVPFIMAKADVLSSAAPHTGINPWSTVSLDCRSSDLYTGAWTNVLLLLLHYIHTQRHAETHMHAQGKLWKPVTVLTRAVMGVLFKVQRNLDRVWLGSLSEEMQTGGVRAWSFSSPCSSSHRRRRWWLPSFSHTECVHMLSIQAESWPQTGGRLSVKWLDCTWPFSGIELRKCSVCLGDLHATHLGNHWKHCRTIQRGRFTLVNCIQGQRAVICSSTTLTWDKWHVWSIKRVNHANVINVQKHQRLGIEG